MNISDLLNEDKPCLRHVSSTAPRCKERPIASHPKKQSRRSPEKDQNTYFEIVVRDKPVRMRTADCSLDATQIITAGGKGFNERNRILKLMKEHTTVNTQGKSSWVCFKHGQLLCEYLGLKDELWPLLNHAAMVMTSEEHHVPLTNYLFPPYLEVPIGTQFVAVNKTDLWVNLVHIVRAAGKDKTEVAAIKRRDHPSFKMVDSPVRYKGSYVSFEDALRYSQSYNLEVLTEKLQEVRWIKAVSC